MARTIETATAAPDAISLKQVASALARLDEHLGADWTDLLSQDGFPALLVKLERVRRRLPGPALDEAVRSVEGLQRQRLSELLAEFDLRLDARELKKADALLEKARSLSDDAGPLDRATARMTRALDEEEATKEGRLKLGRARELAAPPHPPRKLKQALKLYDDLLRKLDTYVGLKPEFELIKGERDEAERLIKVADTKESQRATAIAIGRIDDLVETREIYVEGITTGKMDEAYARSRIDEIERSIGEKLTEKVDEYLKDADEIARNPRDAAVALERLTEHERLWDYLPKPEHTRVRRRAEEIQALVARRTDALRRRDRSSESIANGDYVEAIRQLCILRDLNAELQIDVQRPLDVAIDALEHRLERRLTLMTELLGEVFVTEDELSQVMTDIAELRESLDPVSGHVPRLQALQIRATEVERETRRLRGELERADREIARVRDLVEQGKTNRARRLVERLERSMPPQRRGEIADLKEEVDLVVEEDEIESRLEMLAVSNPQKAADWAEKHSTNMACRRYRRDANAAGVLLEIEHAENAGEYGQALMLANRFAQRAPDNLKSHVAEKITRLERVKSDSMKVERHLERLRAAQRDGRLSEMLSVFTLDLAIPAHLAAEWEVYREEGMRQDRARIAADLERALEDVRGGREAWQSVAWPFPNLLAPVDDPSASFESTADPLGQLKDALRALDTASSAASVLEGKTTSSALQVTLHTLRIEDVVCRAEARIARSEFEAAREALDEASLDKDSRFSKVRQRLNRLSFARHFEQAIATNDFSEAEACLEMYDAPSSDEATLARRIVRMVRLIETSTEAGASPSALRRELTDLYSSYARLAQQHPAIEGPLAPHVTRLKNRYFDALETERDILEDGALPFGRVAAISMLDAALEDAPFGSKRLQRNREEWIAGLGRAVRSDLDMLEQMPTVEAFSTEQLLEVEHRLEALSQIGDAEGPQIERCRQRLHAQRTTRSRQRDAEKRRDALLRRAIDRLDQAALDGACALETEGHVPGDAACQERERWLRAQPIVDALHEAMGARAFERVGQLLDQLERTGSAAHMMHMQLADPFEPTCILPAGIERLRATLPELMQRSEAAVVQRAQALAEIEELLGQLEAGLARLAAAAPVEVHASPEFPEFLNGVFGSARRRMDDIVHRLDNAVDHNDPNTGQTAERYRRRLPPLEPTSFIAFFERMCVSYREDHRFVMSCCQAPTHVLRQHREQLLDTRQRWSAIPELVRLIDDLLR